MAAVWSTVSLCLDLTRMLLSLPCNDILRGHECMGLGKHLSVISLQPGPPLHGWRRGHGCCLSCGPTQLSCQRKQQRRRVHRWQKHGGISISRYHQSEKVEAVEKIQIKENNGVILKFTLICRAYYFEDNINPKYCLSHKCPFIFKNMHPWAETLRSKDGQRISPIINRMKNSLTCFKTMFLLKLEDKDR